MPTSKEKQIVIKAINELGRRVSIADITTKTGLPVSCAAQTVNQIAAETGGHLQVSSQGDIAYLFPIGYQTRYITRGIRRIADLCGQQIFALAFFLLRISFGIMLILSLAIIAIIFFVIIFTASRSRDNEEFSFDFDFFDWMILRELFLWNFSYTTPSYAKYDHVPARGSQKTNFLYNCFSFLFGDGNPNANMDERRWQGITQLIKENHGSLTSDQLSPYTGISPDNEDAVLPILVRFDGQPSVSESGNIIYLFPALQATAINEPRRKSLPHLNEFTWQFSRADAGSMTWIVILAAINFLGSWWLYFQALKLPAFLPLMPLLSVLVIYGTAFIAIPLVRYLIIQTLNKRIQSSNQLRQDYASRLDHPDEKLQTKLAEAKTMQFTQSQIKADDLIYDTQKDVLEQQFPSIMTTMQ